MGTREVAEAFVDAINSGRAERISPLMTQDHVFIDSLGAQVTGRSAMLDGWRAYFRVIPDYRIAVEGWYVEEQTALLHGWASGTVHRDFRPVPGGAWRIPAAWRLVSDGKRVALWQVYADNKPVYALLGG